MKLLKIFLYLIKYNLFRFLFKIKILYYNIFYVENIYIYCLKIIYKLEYTINVKDFGMMYVSEKMKFFELFQRKDNIILSSSHGINLFENIIKYYNNPDDYIEIPRDKKGKPLGDLKYENNFKNLIKINKI